MALGSDAPIIIKRIKKVAAGHHGGAWKVAYADFVTAMMAFFLLMWLINTTSPEQKKGIADYFAPASVSETTSGSGGILGGTALGQDGEKNAGSQNVIEQTSPQAPDTGASTNQRPSALACPAAAQASRAEVVVWSTTTPSSAIAGRTSSSTSRTSLSLPTHRATTSHPRAASAAVAAARPPWASVQRCAFSGERLNTETSCPALAR